MDLIYLFIYFIIIGPSGHNREYLFHLCEALRELSPQYRDSHLCELEELVKKLIEKN